MRKPIGTLLVALALGAVATCNACPQGQQTAETWAEVAAAAYRAEGHSLLLLDGPTQKRRGFSINLDDDRYPIDANRDDAFFSQLRVEERLHESPIVRFELLCGKKNGGPLRTEIRFWSGPRWDGTSQPFTCGGNGAYEIEGAVQDAHSFCVYTEDTNPLRAARCNDGPKCDDADRNGNETDVDCGGSCRGCLVGQTCATTSDCAGTACSGGSCSAPSCSDGLKNGSETDVDCGGGCQKCVDGMMCEHNSDCLSDRCWNNRTECVPGPNTSSDPCDTVFSPGSYALTVDGNGCGDLRGYRTTDPSTAEMCAQGDGFTTVSSLCNYEVLVETGPAWYTTVLATSESEAERCVRETLCSSCTPHVVDQLGCAP